ncbi:TOPRIM domain protein [Dethiosulfovibrio peptidovorans DSM 11002]|uniref:TOPRIM domain protein n=1 Tax=Dethiosulfovibrio peptidovorans DSM 11002 TaxID=469381 RepID=D2Z4A0_9BACT|nr:TOPRIM domain protein [Dethiosulfovibrio peptidovorans DSM 11002]
MSKADLKRWCEEILPHHITWKGDDGTTRSPLREDKNPSFSVSLEGRCFNDFATGDKGTFSELAGRLGVNPPPWEGPGHRASGAPRKKEDSPVEDKKIEEARRTWGSGSPAPADHPYLVAKGIFPHGCRMETGGQYDGWLLVPGRSIETGEVVSVQRVTYRKDDRNKWDKRHQGPKKGTVWACGDAPKGSPVILTEGHATAASVKEIVGEGYQVLCVFGTNNVKPIAEAIRRRSPDRQIVIATDGDAPGEKALKETAKAVPGVLRCTPDKGIDWNDAVVQRGIDEARRDFMDRLNTSKAVAEIKALAEEERREVKAVSIGDIWDTEYPATKWAVNQLVPAGLSILASPPKRGKSWLVLQMALAVSEGYSFLGQTTTQGPVIYAALEDTPRRIQDRTKGLSMRRPSDTLSLVFDLPPLDHGGMEELARLILEKNPSLVIVDTWGKVKPSPEKGLNAFEADYKMAGPLKKLADKTETAILLVHHLKKGAKGEDIESMSGSMGLPAAADALIFLKRGEGEDRAKLDRQGRDLDETDSIPLLWDRPGWRRATSQELFVEEAESLPEKEAAIIDFFEEMNCPLSPAQVIRGLNERPGTIKAGLARLVEKGLLIKVGRGVYELPQGEKKGSSRDLFLATSATSATFATPATFATLPGAEEESCKDTGKVAKGDSLATFDKPCDINGWDGESCKVAKVADPAPTRDPHPSCGNALSVSELSRLMDESVEDILIGLDDLNKCREENGLPPALEVDRGTGQVALLARSPDGDLPDDLDDEEDEELEVVEEIPEEVPPEEEPTRENPSPCGDPEEDVRAPGPPDDPPEYQTDDPEYLNSLECLEHLENLEGEVMSW